MDHLPAPYSIPAFLLTKNGPQIERTFSAIMITLLGVECPATTVCSAWADGQAKRFKKNIIICLRHNVAKHQKDWGTLDQPSTDACNTQVYSSTMQTTISLVFSRHPQGPVLLKAGSASLVDDHAETCPPLRISSRLKACIRAVQRKASISVAFSHKRYNGDYVWPVRVAATFKSNGCV